MVARILGVPLALAVSLPAAGCGSRTGLPVGAAQDAPPGGDGGLSPQSSNACPYTSGPQAGAPWPMVGRCPDHAAHADVAGSSSNNVKWTAPLGAPPWQPVIGAGGILYAAAGTKLFAITGSGVVSWTFDAHAPIGGSPAIADAGTVYVASMNPMGQNGGPTKLHAVDPEGRALWATDLPGGSSSIPILGADGTVYLGLGAALHAVRPDGTVIWHHAYPPNGFGESPPAIGADGTLYVTLSGRPNLLAIDPSGDPLWQFDVKDHDARYELGAAVDTSAAVAPDGTAYFATGMGDSGSFSTVFAVDRHGNLRWARDFGYGTGGPHDTAVAIAPDGSVVGSNSSGTIASFTPAGVLSWTFETKDVASSPVLDVDGTVYVGGLYHFALTAVSAGGTLAWLLPLSSSVGAPSIAANGDLVVATEDGMLYAIGR